MIWVKKRNQLDKVRVKLISPEREYTINSVISAGINMTNIDYLDSISVSCCVDALRLKELETIAARYGGEVVVMQPDRLHAAINSAQRRCVLIVAVCIMIALTAWLPTRVLFILIDGNREISDKLILEKAEICGIQFGVPRHLVRSEGVKNRLLSELPQLRWVGVNTKGCVAVISVVEKEKLSTEQDPVNISSIIASCDGVIQELTVYSGTPLCQPGQAVRKGQMLVSGYTDCGLTIRAEGAHAEIVAQTKRSLTTVTPANCFTRGETERTTYRYCLQVGKKSIKLFKDSGISEPLCVRMYYEKPWRLPGGFILPISLQVEELRYADVTYISRNQSAEWLRNASNKYINTQMLSGRILESAYVQGIQNGLCFQDAVYDCVEYIGKVKIEEGLGCDGE